MACWITFEICPAIAHLEHRPYPLVSDPESLRGVPGPDEHLPRAELPPAQLGHLPRPPGGAAKQPHPEPEQLGILPHDRLLDPPVVLQPGPHPRVSVSPCLRVSVPAPYPSLPRPPRFAVRLLTRPAIPQPG